MDAENPLHRARLGLGISLTELAARTCLSPRIVQKIDAGQFDQLPGGIYARSYVRTFAAFVNLDPEEVVRELSERLPPDEDPFPALRENARAHMPAWVATVTEWPGRAVACGAARLWPSADTERSPASDRDVPDAPPARNRLSPPSPLATVRCATVLVDAGALFLLYAVFVRVTAWTLGVSVDEAIRLAGVAVAVPWAVIAVLYFVLLGGVAGRTLGAAVCGLRAPHRAEPLDPRSIWWRAFSLTADRISQPSSESTGGWPADPQPLDTADSNA